jgi:hypothetical protein
MHIDLRALLALVRDITGIDLVARPHNAPVTTRVDSARRISVHAVRDLDANAAALVRLLDLTKPAYARFERQPLDPSEKGAVDIIVTRLRQQGTLSGSNRFRDD